jgi:N-acetylmuramoyl-L-alanine amidase-like protein/flagellar hook capping protein FlgD
MTLPRALIIGFLLSAFAAGTASASDVRLVGRDEPVGRIAARSAARAAPLRFDMIGLHWRGSGTVTFRTRSLAGVWSTWRPARPEAEDLPDRGTTEAAARPGWKLGNAYWTGPASSIQYRFAGQVTRLRAFFIWSDPADGPLRAPARAAQPGIISRAQWGANEAIVRAAPYYARRVRFAVVHHTAGTNSYSKSQSAAIVRGIERYHVLGNGWNDIGYNFLIDKYGQIFEGRGGGIDKNVVGAHAQGFNTGSTGVSVLGTYSSSRISLAARAALVRLLAWRLDVAHVDPLSRLTWISGGNPGYPAGRAVQLRAVSGHRDTGPTSCPGRALYAQLPRIASAIAARGLPKLYDPAISGSLGGAVRIRGRLSKALPWAVTITDQDGGVVASGSGSGTSVEWTWNASSTPLGTFSYTISAGPYVRPWTARVPGPPPLAVQRVAATPQVLTPNGDGVGESTTLSFWLTIAASVSVEVVNGSGSVVRRLASSRSFAAGRVKLPWDGRDGSTQPAADGRYAVRFDATSPGQSASATKQIVVDRTLGNLTVSPRAFSPNGDGLLDSTAVAFALTRSATVRVRIMRGSSRVATLFSGTLAAGSRSFPWHGSRVAGGTYVARVDATTSLGMRVLRRTVRVDLTRPSVRILSAAARSRTRVTFRLSERARVTMWFGPVTWRGGEHITFASLSAGKHSVFRNSVYGGVRIVALDVAGNHSSPVSAKVPRI